MYKHIRLVSLLAIDALLVILSVYFAYLLRFDFSIRPQFTQTLPYVFMMSIIFVLGSFYLFKIYKRIWQYASVGDLLAIAKGAFVGIGAFFLLHHYVIHEYYPHVVVPRSIYPLTIIICFIAVGGSRTVWRLLRDKYVRMRPYHRKVLIVGAGEAGVMVVKELRRTNSEQYPVAFIDDDSKKQNYEVMGLPVIGTRKDIPKAVKQYKIDEIIVAIPSAARAEISDIIRICKGTGCQIKTLPAVHELINGKIAINKIRNVSVEDLLGRDPVKVDLNEIAGYLKGQAVLVTGAGGSIGSEISRQVASIEPGRLILLDHSENSIYDIELELRKTFPQLQLSAVIGDIKDENRLRDIFEQYRPDVVFHAAAHKHVPLMEDNPKEAVINNVFGTRNTAKCAHEYKAKRFVLISTDKAVNPTSVMGATKRIAEMIIQDLNDKSDTIFTAVRFGNVLGSRGSVIPLFKKQIEEGGPVTVTHPDMVRYFMTIPEAVQLVIQAGAYAKGGEIFILDMGQPVRIADLAYDLIRLSGLEPGKDIQIVYTGIRPGEKLFEELLSQEEGASATKHDRIYVGKPIKVSSDDLQTMIANLKDATTPEEIRRYLQSIVPTFQYKSGPNDLESSQVKDKFLASLEVVAALEQNSGSAG